MKIHRRMTTNYTTHPSSLFFNSSSPKPTRVSKDINGSQSRDFIVSLVQYWCRLKVFWVLTLCMLAAQCSMFASSRRPWSNLCTWREWGALHPQAIRCLTDVRPANKRWLCLIFSYKLDLSSRRRTSGKHCTVLDRMCVNISETFF